MAEEKKKIKKRCVCMCVCVFLVSLKNSQERKDCDGF